MVQVLEDQPKVKRIVRFLNSRKGVQLLILLVLITGTLITFQQLYVNQDIRQRAGYDAATKAFVDNFDGDPANPQPFTQTGQNNWDIQVHSRQPNFWYTLENINAQHGHDCAAPPATHNISAYTDMVFNCRNHIMTALNASDYGVIYLTPGAMADWSNGPAVIEWEMSTERQSVRDWPDVWITPFGENLALPLDNGLPDLQGQPKNAIHITFNTTESAPLLEVTKNGSINDFGMAGWNVSSMRSDIASGTNQAATRQKFRLTLTSTTAKFERLASATAAQLTFWNKTFSNLGFTEGVIQFGHHSYTPTKDNSGNPGTWHWDAVFIKPAVPLTFIKADKRYVDGSGGTVTFQQPAPANAYLRFAAIGNIKVNGSTVNPQPSTRNNEFGEHFKSYFVPIPQGTKQVTLAMTQSSSYPAFAKDFSIWSKGAPVGGPNPTNPPATPVPTVAVTNTPVPTVAPTNAPTSTPVTPTIPKNSVLSLNPATRSVVHNQTFDVQVRVNTNGQTINGVEAGINYPTNLVDVVSITGNTSVFDVEAQKTSGNGVVRLAYGSTVPRSGSTLVVATITFRGKAAGTANMTFTSDSIIVSDISNTNVANQATGGTYTIAAPTPTNTPTPTPTPSPTPIPAKIGDMNGDNIIDIQDLSYLLSRWGGNDSKADINKDGRVNTFDLSALLSNWRK